MTPFPFQFQTGDLVEEEKVVVLGQVEVVGLVVVGTMVEEVVETMVEEVVAQVMEMPCWTQSTGLGSPRRVAAVVTTSVFKSLL